MRRAIVLLVLVVVVAATAGAIGLRGRGISARRSSLPGEERLARAAWRHLVPASVRDAANPAGDTAEVRMAAMAHFADHCATCHGNDGSGDTTLGRNMYPQVPDLRAAGTQKLTDGELFYAIESGIPWTGMPAWGSGTEEGQHESWELVRLIRYLPRITADEVKQMEKLNPRGPAEAEPKGHGHGSGS